MIKLTPNYLGFEKPVRKMIATEISKGGDWKWAIDGKSGSGKSTFCLRVLWDFDRDLDGKRRVNPSNLKDFVFFSSKDLIKALNGISKDEPGHAFIWEEAAGSQGANSRTWWSKKNNEIVEVFQICRKKRALLLINMQSLRDLDISLRTKVHMQSTCKRVDYHQTRGSAEVVSQTKIFQPHYYKNEPFGLPLSYMNYESGLRHSIREFRVPVAPDKLYTKFLTLEDEYKNMILELRSK